jgi:tetratricopeptide (TPR) repeat protein
VKTIIPALLLCALALVHAPGALARCEVSAGRFVSVERLVDFQRAGSSEWRGASLGEELCEGDTIRVGDRSRAAVQLIDDTVLRLDQNTAMRLLNVPGVTQDRSWLEVLRGGLQSFSRRPTRLKVSTPYLNGLIEGTEFVVRVEEGASSLLVLEGEVLAENDLGRVVLSSGQLAVARPGEAPRQELVVRPRDAVQWALHYPPLLIFDPEAYRPGPGWEGAVRRSIEYQLAGDPVNALDSLADVDALAEPRFLVYRASLLLRVGRVDQAGVDLERALTLSPGDAEALALLAVVAVVQNDVDRALDLAGQAIAVAPGSATPLIALSFAQQARFDLEGARDSLEEAVRLAPDNALAWARLAELRSSFGLLDGALEAARTATDLDPNLSRTQTVLGFAYLLRVDTAQAKASFGRAIALDPADPMPRLGLGLARIAEGDLRGGRGELDIAASLDPNRSLIRSYLGKAYHEERRGPLAEQQYLIAQELDPNDPTPWFYDALAKQTENRPVEALRNLQRAIELNDNRAVYRSRLLLDADLAARSASLARVYSDLGFQQRALVEGWKSVNTDPTNFSAHRFLADSYAVLPRHEIARVSALLQSQLLQPLNMTPVQPRLGESNLFLINSGGPGTLSFNEFNPLFYREGQALQASALAGGDSTSSVEAVVAGISGNVAYSVGAFTFETDGFRPNADQKDDIFNAFLQAELSPETSIQAEYRYRDAETGDLQLRFFPEEYRPGLRNPLETHSFRIGGRHQLAPNSVLLGSVIYSDADYGAFDTEPPVPGLTFAGVEDPEKALSGEIQHLFRSARFSLTSGVGHLDRDGEADFTIRTVFPPPFDEIRATEDTDLRHTNLYAYSNLQASDDLTVTLGFSGEFWDSSSVTVKDGDEFNPKFGLMWTPARDTLVRLAAFRATKRPIVANQTLEPTQVAGFNQFYDDFNFTVSTRYGVAIDQHFSSSLFGGVELSRRDLDVPATDLASAVPSPITVDWREELARAYLFWTPHLRVGLTAEYQFERIRRDEELTDGVREADTHRLQFGIRYFHPSGISASVTPAYYSQDGLFESSAAGGLASGNDDFWIVDAAVSYRLPGRRGFLTAGVSNLFDQEFSYFDIDFNNPSIRPGRTLFASATLAF